MLRNRLIALGLLSAVMLSALAVGVAPAADHRDAPNLTFFPASGPTHPNPELRALDLNDVYVFRSPSNPNNTVLALTVNPFIVPGEATFFSSQGSYEFVINNGNDTNTATPLLRPEITFRCNFTAPRAGRQEIRVTRVNHVTNRSELIARGQTGSNIAIRGGGQLRADVFDDPFFFDFRAFQGDRDGPEGTAFGAGTREFNDELKFDFFAGANTGVILLEVASSTLTGGTGEAANVITVWSRTLNGSGVQVDRTAIPAINTVLIRPNRFIGPFPGTPNPLAPTAPNFKNQFNLTLPVNDRSVWGEEARRSLGLFGSDATRAAAVADLLLPDILTFNTTLPVGSGFVPGLNGRRLEDDVIDFELQVVLDNSEATDGVSHGPFRTRFPYFLPQN